VIAGFDKKICRDLYAMGENMGIGFQLMDDYLDVYADKAKFGKQVGGDIISNKKTYLLINALNRANSEQLSELNTWLRKSDFDPFEKVEAITSIYNEIGIPDLVKEQMDFYFNKALNELDQVPADEDAKSELKKFALSLLKREK
jgi:geranylgeranyl diphosphate synthase type II